MRMWAGEKNSSRRLEQRRHHPLRFDVGGFAQWLGGHGFDSVSAAHGRFVGLVKERGFLDARCGRGTRATSSEYLV